MLVDGRPTKLGGRRQQLVLATLLSHANLTVSQDVLIDEVWAGEPPEAAKSTLQSYIYGLRQALGTDTILRQGEGYRVDVDASSFDSIRFEDLTSGGRKLIESDPEGASGKLSEALALWHGSPYEGLDSPTLLMEATRLEELRLAATELRMDAELTLGNHTALIGELDTLVRSHPLRERFRAQQMLALYRSGRQAEALRAYQQARNHLADELGIEPSPELQELEQRILEQDPGLSQRPAAEFAAESRPLRGYELGAVVGTGDFGTVYRARQPSVQREVAIKVIRAEHANRPDFVHRFEREAQTVAELDHPHVVPLYDFWRDPDGAYLVMPMMRGGSLESAVGEGGWSIPRALAVLEQIGGAVAHAHRRGVIHRDIKPANVLLDSDGNAYLSDFGIARHSGDVLPDRVGTSPGVHLDMNEDVGPDIFGLGYLAFRLLTGVSPTPGWPLPRLSDARPDLPPELGRVLARATEANPSVRYRRVDDFVRAFKQTAGADVVTISSAGEEAPDSTRNPYKGLRAFRDFDAADFFGRDALVDDLLMALTKHNVVALVGPSGSGKSSVVRAGLIPELRAQAADGSHQWLMTDMFPGSHPFEELEAALLKVAVDRPSNLLSELADEGGLLRITKRILPSEDTTLLLVIDQFEEMFSTVTSETTRRMFIDNIVAVAGDERSKVKVVLTLRADYLDRPLTYHPFSEVVGRGLVTVGPPGRDGLAQAIAAPARAVGVDVEPGLIGKIVSDLENQPGALPMLQFALTELFATREGSSLTIAKYEEMGGVRRALGSRAEELYAEMSESVREGVRQIFLRMVNVTEEKRATRRRVTQAELRGLSIDQRAVDLVLDRFGSLRLIAFDRDPITRNPTVELAHEAILDEWKRLRDWVEEYRESLIVARRISGNTQDWVISGHDPSFLLRGSRLRQAEDWLASTDLAHTDEEEVFIQASLDLEEAEDRAARRRRRRTIVALAGGLALVSLLAIVAIVQRGVAEHEALRARVRELTVASGSHIEQNPELALLVAVEAFDESIRADGEPMVEAASAVARAIQDWRLIGRYPSGKEFLPVASPGGSLIATASVQSSADVDLLDAGGSSVRTLVGSDHPGAVAWTGEFHPVEDTIAIIYVPRNESGDLPDGVPEVVVFDAKEGTALRQLDLNAGASGVSFSPSGKWLAVSSGRGVQVFDWDETVEVSRLISPANVGQPYFLDDNRILIPVEGSGFATYTIDDGRMIDEIPLANLSLITAADDNRSRLAYRAGDRIGVVDLSTGDNVFDSQAPGVTALALDPDGSRLAYSGFDSNIYVVPVEGEGAELELAGTLANVHALNFVDSDRLLSYGEDALLWDVSPAGPDELGAVDLAETPYGFQVSPDMDLLSYYVSAGLGASDDPADGVRLVDLESGNETLVVEQEIMTIKAGYRRMSPDFTMVGSLTQEGVSTVRRLPSWEVIRRFEDCRSPMALTSDNSRVLLTGWACAGTTPAEGLTESEVVEMDSGEPIVTIPYETIWSAAFNPAGFSEAGRYLVATDQLTVEIWDLVKRESIGHLAASELGNVAYQLLVAFDPTGRYIVGGTTSGTVWVLDMERVVGGADMVDAIVFSRQAHTGATPGPALNADGVVATVGFDGMVRLWDLDSENLLLEFEADVGAPMVRFTPDGTHLLYPHGSSIRRIPVDAHELRALAGQLLTRDFLPDECSRYARQERCDALES